ncbi:MAG: hypothetical protein PHC34_03000 [Candidatus Gastranaerophilales bacterium]|nr:hypothetical protein [Candidatus Gastranaerophilales bacterium]
MNDTERQEEMHHHTEEMHHQAHHQAEELQQKASEVQEKVAQSINMAMNSAADSLDVTANKMQEASKFFRDKNVDSIKDDVSGFIKKYPGQTLAGALIFGFLFGKVLSR